MISQGICIRTSHQWNSLEPFTTGSDESFGMAAALQNLDFSVVTKLFGVDIYIDVKIFNCSNYSNAFPNSHTSVNLC